MLTQWIRRTAVWSLAVAAALPALTPSQSKAADAPATRQVVGYYEAYRGQRDLGKIDWQSLTRLNVAFLGFDRTGLAMWMVPDGKNVPDATHQYVPTVRALVADILNQEFVPALRAKGLMDFGVFRHVVKNAAPTALAVMGLQLGYLLGGSILIETVFSWPGTGFLLNAAIFQRDLPLLQGTILVLALFFVFLNLIVDLAQAAIDPRIKRS